MYVFPSYPFDVPLSFIPANAVVRGLACADGHGLGAPPLACEAVTPWCSVDCRLRCESLSLPNVC